MKFTPCSGRDACTEGGTHCRGCNRTHAEIAQTRNLIHALADHAMAMNYQNADEFLDYVAQKARKKIAAGRA
jgi:predicted Fe-S protein YdhL (DUF1289 family)